LSTESGGPSFPPCPPPPGPGDPAPPLKLPWKLGEDPFDLDRARSRGPVVVLFFPMAFSPTCTEELCQVRDGISHWGSLGEGADDTVTVVAVSVDSIFVNTRFARELGVDFPLLSDFNREACTAWGVREDDYFGQTGVAKRAAFLVGQGGQVVWGWVTDDDSVLPDPGEVKAALRSLA